MIQFLQIASIRCSPYRHITVRHDQEIRREGKIRSKVFETTQDPPDRVVVVGDSPFNVQAASKAGINTIGGLCGRFPEDELPQAGAIAIYRDPAEILEKYNESPIASTG